MSGSSGGFNAEDIRLCYRYLKEAESLPTGIAKSRFREASQEDKQTILARAKAWDGTLPATGTVSDSAPPARSRGRPRRTTAPDTKPYSLLLPVDDLAALQVLSQEQGESVSFHIREAIRGYLKSRRKEAP